ncbi:hypothetical protein [Lichenicola sp.]|uniref:hypothetical protein n=1 Tax=Lichenicola sp. TaxID=2804529 RepID=UPI003B0081D7
MSVLLAGCAQQSDPVTVAQALQSLQRELADAGAVSAVGSAPVQFAAAARSAQCAAGRADPEIPLLAHDLTLDLSGSFSATGGFTIGTAVVGTSLIGNATRGQTQELVLPISFVALSELPAFVAEQRLAPLAALPDADRRMETARVLLDRDGLRARVAALIASWSPRLCPATRTERQPSPGLFQPNARPAL